jgi:hypothetical protein
MNTTMARALTLPMAIRSQGDGISLVLHARPIATALTFVTVVVLFSLSSTMLNSIGVPYAAPGGNALFKFHPATYMAVLAAIFWVAADGGPAAFLDRNWRESPGTLAFLAGIVLLTFQVVAVQKTPLSQVADNFILTFLVFSALMRLEDRASHRLAFVLHALFLFNSALGYVEVIGHFRLTPLYVNGELADYDWRSTALFGHPLVNAMQTSLYIMALALGAGPFRPLQRTALVAFHCGAMLCFGGRTGTMLTLLALSGFGAVLGVRVLLGQRFKVTTAALVIAGLTAAIVVGVLAYQGGLFDKFLSRFQDDSGSAHTRVAMLSIFRAMPLSEVLIAPNPATIHDTQLKLDLAIAIESSVVGFVAYYGGIVTGFFFLGLGCYFSEFVRRFGPKALVPLAAYCVMSAVATSIATKSIEMAMWTSTLMLLFRQPAYRPDKDLQPRC